MEDNTGGNGKVKKQEEKTVEQLAQERLERYQKDPNSFIELSQIICMAIRNPKSQLGLSIFVGNVKRTDLDIGQIELNHMIDKVRMNMDIKTEMVKQAGIVKPKNGIMDFARRK